MDEDRRARGIHFNKTRTEQGYIVYFCSGSAGRSGLALVGYEQML